MLRNHLLKLKQMNNFFSLFLLLNFLNNIS
jgi:hypothetical protein